MKNIFLEGRGDYIGGAFVPAKSPKKKEYLILSPADRRDKVFRFFSDPAHPPRAAASASKAFPLWSSLSQEERNRRLKKLSRIFKARKEEIAVLISRETGKPLEESRQEAGGLAQKVEITLKQALPLVRGTRLCSVRPGAQGKTFYRPRGVFLVLGPFNFPVHLPCGWILPALATGNTVIFKASEKAPACAEKLSECFHQAGFPAGVFNLVQGGADSAKALLNSPEISGLLFTGSYRVGREIKKQLLDQPEKILALEMGGKNSAIVHKDADLENAAQEILKGAYLTCGQRCSATSRLILHKDIKKAFLKRFIALSRQIKIGHWSQNPFIGPLIDQKSVDRFLSAVKEAEDKKAVIHLKGKKAFIRPKGFYVRPAIVEPLKYDPKSFYQNEELFAPFVTVYTVDKEEEAFSLVNQGGYGLCLSLFCKSKSFAKKALLQSRVGVFHWNLSSSGASSRLPFGGLGKSGNDRPAGLFAVYQTCVPVAYLKKAPALE